MQLSEYDNADVLHYFSGHPVELELFEALLHCVAGRYPQASMRVQKSQIGFYERHLFLAVSLPLRRKKDWPKQCLMVTFGLPYPLSSPRIAMTVEPYPGRWTHHVLLTDSGQVDGELLKWLDASWNFSQQKR